MSVFEALFVKFVVNQVRHSDISNRQRLKTNNADGSRRIIQLIKKSKGQR